MWYPEWDPGVAKDITQKGNLNELWTLVYNNVPK